MATDQVILPKDILDAVIRVRRMGVEPLLKELEHQEPDLAEIVLEEISLIHQRITATGISAKKGRHLIHRIESLILVAVAATRQGHRRLWENQGGDAPLRGDDRVPSETTVRLRKTPEKVSRKTNGVSIIQLTELHVDRRELATILAALRCHQDENLQSGGKVADHKVRAIATDEGSLVSLGFEEVEQLCQRLNAESSMPQFMAIEPPPQEQGEEPLFRVVYVIDLNAADARQAAERAYQMMSDPASIPPILHLLSDAASLTTIDLASGVNQPPTN